MKYVIYCPKTGKYLSIGKKCMAGWVDACSAHRFDEKQSVDNYMQNNFRTAVRNGIFPEDTVIVPCDEQGVPMANITSSEVEITEEQANQYITFLTEQMSGMYEVGRLTRILISFYAEQISIADKTQEDLLHKIEFTNANVVEGFKLYKALHEIRLQRRKYKDTCEMLGLFNRSGLINSLIKLENGAISYQSNLENRTYTPRVLEDLFSSISTANLSKSLAGKVADIPNETESEEDLNEPA